MDEGYVKYVAERRDGIVPHSAQLDELNQARTALFDLGLIGVYPDGVGYGNLSFRNSGNQFVITASATGALAARVVRVHDAWRYLCRPALGALGDARAQPGIV